MALLGTVTEYPEIIVLKEGIKKFLVFHGNVNIFMSEKAVRCNLNFCGHWSFSNLYHMVLNKILLSTLPTLLHRLWNSQKTQ